MHSNESSVRWVHQQACKVVREVEVKLRVVRLRQPFRRSEVSLGQCSNWVCIDSGDSAVQVERSSLDNNGQYNVGLVSCWHPVRSSVVNLPACI